MVPYATIVYHHRFDGLRQLHFVNTEGDVGRMGAPPAHVFSLYLAERPKYVQTEIGGSDSGRLPWSATRGGVGGGGGKTVHYCYVLIEVV
jgi:hypothetical protein